MVNSKRKGSNFEREAREILQDKLDGKWKRVAGSGALGTNLDEPLLTGDIVGKVDSFPKSFRIDAKVGYGGSTQLTVKKEWIDKIRREADATYSIPALVCKFSGAREGAKTFVILDMDAFVEVIMNSENLREEIDKIIWKIQTGKGLEK